MTLAHRLKRPDGRRAAVLAGSVLLHMGVLTLLVWGARQAPTPLIDVFSDTVPIRLEPWPTIPGARPHAPRQPEPDEAPASGTRAQRIDPTPSPPATATPRPADLTPHLAPAPPAEAPPPPDHWTLRPESAQAAAGRAMRTSPLGCRTMSDQLTEGERALCDDRFVTAAARAGPIGPRTLTPNEARREAEFAREGAAALARYEAIRRPLAGGTGVLVNGDCPGGNLGAGCAGAFLPPEYRQGATSVIQP